MTSAPLTDDLIRLRCCDAPARKALDADNEPFGSMPTDSDGREVFADRNRVAGGDQTWHPELDIGRGRR